MIETARNKKNLYLNIGASNCFIMSSLVVLAKLIQKIINTKFVSYSLVYEESTMGVYMKNLLSMLLVFSFLLTIGCEDDEATTPDTVVGVWNMISITILSDGNTMNIDAGSDYSMVMTFNEDGTYSNQGVMDGESHSESGTWSASGNTLTTIFDDEGETITDVWDYTLSGSSLSITITETDEEGTFTITYNFTIHIFFFTTPRISTRSFIQTRYFNMIRRCSWTR